MTIPSWVLFTRTRTSGCSRGEGRKEGRGRREGGEEGKEGRKEGRGGREGGEEGRCVWELRTLKYHLPSSYFKGCALLETIF